MGIGDWGLGMGDWGLAQSPIPIPNPQSPIPNPQYIKIFVFKKNKFICFIYINWKKLLNIFYEILIVLFMAFIFLQVITGSSNTSSFFFG